MDNQQKHNPQEQNQTEPELKENTAEEEREIELAENELLTEAQQLAERLTVEKEQLSQQHLRLQADFDNFRKRSRQEREDLVKLANTQLILSLLPVLDNFERALSALPEDSGREGVQMIQRQLLEALAVAGLKPIEAIGADFDPQLHEAILQSEAEPAQKGKVLGEALKGYLLNEKLLRASMVQVGM
ncbi:MAG: nucleotide exchange factor GrpE [Clostridiales bacterium]|nr:nucleotide exchange factor GrpE [Clostridiales bacterium]